MLGGSFAVVGVFPAVGGDTSLSLEGSPSVSSLCWVVVQACAPLVCIFSSGWCTQALRPVGFSWRVYQFLSS